MRVLRSLQLNRLNFPRDAIGQSCRVDDETAQCARNGSEKAHFPTTTSEETAR